MVQKTLLTISSILNHNKNQNNIQYSEFKHRQNQIGWWHATDKKNRQNIMETFCYLKVRLYNHEVHDFSILYETVFFACYTSQIYTVQVNYSQKVVFTFHFIIWIEILHDTTYFCVEKYISIFDKMTNKRNFLKIINLYYSLFKTPQFHVPPKSNSTMLYY